MSTNHKQSRHVFSSYPTANSGLLESRLPTTHDGKGSVPERFRRMGRMTDQFPLLKFEIDETVPNQPPTTNNEKRRVVPKYDIELRNLILKRLQPSGGFSQSCYGTITTNYRERLALTL